MPNVLFDSMGVQVQVQNETNDRLTTWTSSLTSLGYSLSYTDFSNPISQQLDGIDVLVMTTHQYFQATSPPSPPPVLPDPIPSWQCFSYQSVDLFGIPQWVSGGGGLLLFTNHSGFQSEPPPNNAPYWPINDIALAASFGIATAFATFGTGVPGQTLMMKPTTEAPPAITNGVSSVQAWDSGGIFFPPFSGVGKGVPLVTLPSTGCSDLSGLGYDPTNFVFGALYPFGSGNVIVLGHSGIVGNQGTPQPSRGQIDSGDNLTFLNNCIAYLV